MAIAFACNIGHPSHGNYVYIGLLAEVELKIPDITVERLRAQLELAREVANDLEWALSRLEQRRRTRRTVFMRRKVLEVRERLRAFREGAA
ncbi:MAG: hypothetical protein AMXMBFR33_01870 [Candidatus Xenobia bacterium]